MVYLSGNSFPTDRNIETALTRRLAPLFGSWRGQQTSLDEFAEGRFVQRMGTRIALLKREVPGKAAARRTILFGRSSGGRIATVFASKRPIKAVICLGYPFKNPLIELEPERFEHLGAIAVPTLILQGENDDYGARAFTGTLSLSEKVKLVWVPADHEFRLTDEGWDDVCRHIEAFLLEL